MFIFEFNNINNS